MKTRYSGTDKKLIKQIVQKDHRLKNEVNSKDILV